jgi:hypothetical protein
MSSPDEYWGEVKRLRRECAPVRALVASQTPATADELASMLQRCADNYVSVPGFTDALLNFGMKVSTADPTAATAGLKLWTSFRSVPVVRDALLKRRHPGLFALFRLGTEGKTMAALEDQVTSVWGKAPKSHTAGDLVRIGEFQAYGFQQPVRI